MQFFDVFGIDHHVRAHGKGHHVVHGLEVVRDEGEENLPANRHGKPVQVIDDDAVIEGLVVKPVGENNEIKMVETQFPDRIPGIGRGDAFVSDEFQPGS